MSPGRCFMNDYMTPKEVSEHLGCNLSTVYSYAKEGLLPSFRKKGGDGREQVMFLRDDVIKLVPKTREAGYMDIKEAARYLHYSENTLYSYTRRRLIPFYRFPLGGGKRSKILFLKSELDDWLKSGRA